MTESFTISTYGTATIISADHYQNRLGSHQNIWRVKVTNGPTTAYIHIPTSRDAATTNRWRRLLTPGSTLVFKGTIDNDKMIATEIKVKQKARQLTMDLTDTARTLDKIKASA